MNSVQARRDRPSCDMTEKRCDTKSRKLIAKPFLGEMNSFGSTMEGSGLHRSASVGGQRSRPEGKGSHCFVIE